MKYAATNAIAQALAMQLPPLPEQEKRDLPIGDTVYVIRAYSEESMQAYATLACKERDALIAILQQGAPDRKPVAWWNGLRHHDESDLRGPSFSEAENTGHDIPVYSGWNPVTADALIAELAQALMQLVASIDIAASRDFADVVRLGLPLADAIGLGRNALAKVPK